MARFFIDRPVFATVVSIVIALAGLAAMANLPIAQYPEIAPPEVQVVATYPGAAAEEADRIVAAPLQKEINGVQGMLYQKSQSSSDGRTILTATFETGTDLDIAQVEVQNRVRLAEPFLPQEVVRQGITVKQVSSDLLMVIALRSTDGRYGDLFLANYANLNIVEPLQRVRGCGDVLVFGNKDYSMRLWLNPDRVAQLGLTTGDVAAAVREQNASFPAGRIGQEPNAAPVEMTVPVIAKGRFTEEAEFEDVILRANPDGSLVRFKDVGRAELGARSYDQTGRLNGAPTTFLIAYLRPGANALETKRQVVETLDELSARFPPGVEYVVPYDTTRFVDVSIDEVKKTFAEALLLVVLVVFVFLQTWRATLITAIAIPVSLVGAFAGMYLLGFTINTLTLFGMVLAIGIVVDDAILVVENVERIMHDEGLGVREAVRKAMDEVTGPIVASVLVLASVFVPVGFLGGITGELYKQFAITISVSVAISGIVALSLTPALSAILMRPGEGVKSTGLFGPFNRGFERATAAYVRVLGAGLRRPLLMAGISLAVLGGAYALYRTTPTSFLPPEDQGYLVGVAMLPEGASASRTLKVVERVEKEMLAIPEVDKVVVLAGLNLLAGAAASSNASSFFFPLKPWDERTGPGQHALALQRAAMGRLMRIEDAFAVVFNPPPIRGLGVTGGFEFYLQNRGAGDAAALAGAADAFLGAAAKAPETAAVSTTFRADSPQLYVDLDRAKAKSLGVPISDVFDALQTFLGALYVNDFNKYGRVWRVQLQAEPQFRATPEEIARRYVRGAGGAMVPLGAVARTSFTTGPSIVARYNNFPAAFVSGAAAPGYSSGQAIAAVERLADQALGRDFRVEWTGAALQEKKAGGQTAAALAFGLVMVFLVLAAQYERWSIPLAVMLAVPLSAFGALAAVRLRGMENDIYFQIGLLTLVGLTAKTAILIVEFAAEGRRRGKPLLEAALDAARLRFRPILMTAFTFILGAAPLAFSAGAGSGGRRSIGTGVMGGMISATLLTVFLTPFFFMVVLRIAEGRRKPEGSA